MNQNQKNHSHGKHMLFMVIGCLAPILILVLLNFLGLGNKTLTKAISSFGFLLCPLMHIFMIKGMFSNKESQCHKEKIKIDTKDKLD